MKNLYIPVFLYPEMETVIMEPANYGREEVIRSYAIYVRRIAKFHFPYDDVFLGHVPTAEIARLIFDEEGELE